MFIGSIPITDRSVSVMPFVLTVPHLPSGREASQNIRESQGAICKPDIRYRVSGLQSFQCSHPVQKTVLRFNDTPTHIIHRLQPHSSSSFCDETQGWAAMVTCALAAVQPAAARAPCRGRSLSGHIARLPSPGPRLSGNKLVSF